MGRGADRALVAVIDLRELPLDAFTLRAGYREHRFTPRDVIEEVYRRIAARGDDHVWLSLQPKAAVLKAALALERGDRDLPLYGLPYGVKDNIDVAGLPTTSGCEALRYIAARSATVVEKLGQAGALLLGKQNLDQFATGLVGIRCVGGFCRNALDPRYIPGGSSSGSAVAVAADLTSFSIGSDTGGSGRVPAAYHGIVGLKPTPGLVSTYGFLYCNRSFDVPSIFARRVEDAFAVLEVLREELLLPSAAEMTHGDSFRFAVPRADQLEFFGDAEQARRFGSAVSALRGLGGEPVTVDFTPFVEAGELVFQSALVAERWLTYGATIERHPEAVHPAVRTAISNARKYSAVDAFATLHRLSELQVVARETLNGVACLVTPTVGTLYTVDQVEADPFELNTRMGYYTYFANPLRLSAISVPAGHREDGLPFNLSLVSNGFHELALGRVARALEAATAGAAPPTRTPARPRADT